MSESTGASGQGEQPSDEDVQAYVEQLRGAEPQDIIAQAYTMLGTGAEVKLGRQDARVLIDAMEAITSAAEQRLSGDLPERMRNGVVQLQTAQVQAERQQAGEAQGAGEGAGEAEQGQQAAGPQAGQGQQSAPQGQQGEQGKSAAERLWIPGRGG